MQRLKLAAIFGRKLLNTSTLQVLMHTLGILMY